MSSSLGPVFDVDVEGDWELSASQRFNRGGSQGWQPWYLCFANCNILLCKDVLARQELFC